MSNSPNTMSPRHARPGAAQATSPPEPTTGARSNRWWVEGLDGIRALAIIAVLIFHLRPESLRGGFIGVDVFFIVSGFLITSLLVRELHTKGKVDLPRFWLRRARRLLPALVSVVVLGTVLAMFAGDDLLVGIERHVLGALTFSNNWVEIAAGSDYFSSHTPNLFMNFWSLAVEEQFYLVWPLLALLVMAAVSSTRRRIAIMGAGALVSAIAMAVLLTPGDPTRVYYGTDTHAFGLLIGAGLAFAFAADDLPFLAGRTWQRARVPMFLGGFAVIITLMVNVDGEANFAYRGGLVLASLATAAMVAALPGRATSLTTVLKWRPIAWVGERSYGIYMWHWPVILIVEAAWPPATPDSASWWTSRAIALGATLGLAALSYKYLEEPVRQYGFKQSGRMLAAWMLRLPQRLRLTVSATAVVTVVLFAIAIIVAPEMSTLERAMADGSGYVQTGAETPEPVRPARPPEVDTEKPPAATPESEPPEASESEPPEAPVEPTPSGEFADVDFAHLPGDQVDGFGDSIMYVAAPGLAATLPGMVINAKSNRQWPAIAEEIRKELRGGEVGPVVVIVAGTNAGARDKDLIAGVLDDLGPDRRVVLVNIYSRSSFVAESNEVLASLTSDRPNVALADWYARAKANPDQLQPDKIHPNMEGMYLFAETVEDALADLGVTVETSESD